MLTFISGMDPHSLDIRQDGKHIGFLQWHRGPYHAIFWDHPADLSLSELKSIVAKAEEVIEERSKRQ